MEESQLNIPEGWEGRELGTLYLEKRKSKFKVSDATNYGGIPFYTSGDAVLEHNEIQTDGENIFLATGGIANVKFYNGNVAYSTDTYVIVGKENIDTQFLYFKILDQLYYINTNYFQGSGLKHLQKKDFRKHLFALPKTKTEQQSIANIIAKTEQAIANTEALIAKYTKIKTGLMQDLLTKGIDENGNVRTEQTHEFKDSPLGRIPKEWECDYLSSKVQVQGGYAFKSKDFQTEGVQLIRIGNLYNNQLSLNRDPIFLPKDFLKTLPQFILNKGDIILSMTGTAGKRDYGFAVQINIEEKVFLNQRVCKFLFQEAKIDKDFLLNVLHSEFYLTKLYESVTGTKQANLNSDNILEIYVPFPIIDEQKRISNYLLKVDDFISKSKTELTKLQSLKIGLMQDILSGKVRVNNLKLKEANETALA
jgi:type I restriction enzyme S subunit